MDSMELWRARLIKAQLYRRSKGESGCSQHYFKVKNHHQRASKESSALLPEVSNLPVQLKGGLRPNQAGELPPSKPLKHHLISSQQSSRAGSTEDCPPPNSLAASSRSSASASLSSLRSSGSSQSRLSSSRSARWSRRSCSVFTPSSVGILI